MKKPDPSQFRNLASRFGSAARRGGHKVKSLSRGPGWGGRHGRGRLPLVLGAALGILVVGGAGAWIATKPDLAAAQAAMPAELDFEDAVGNPLYLAHGVTSEYVTLDRIPAHLQEAVIALEDQRFREHGGVDLRGILRAGMRNMVSDGIVEGGSTITQQLVKISYLTPEKSYMRKLREARLAAQMEDSFTKDEILEAYLNRVYMGAGATGVGAGARIYFDTSAANLSLAQSAALAAIIRAPSEINPFSAPDALRDRAALVLDLMEDQGRIDAGVANAARIELATMSPQRGRAPYGGWFADWVKGQADAMTTTLDGAVTLRTTLDPGLQVAAENAVASVLGDRAYEAALVALRGDGSVAAMVGGRDYAQSEFNRATDALRAPGSTFKTFVYLTALQRGMRPEDAISDRPVDIDGYAPQNFDGKFHGDVAMAVAFVESMNAATVQLARTLGIDAVAETARALGIEAELSETPALALGASGVTLLDMTEAYAAIASGRAPVQARGLAGVSGRDMDFHPFEWGDPEPEGRAAQLLEHRGTMTGMLRAVVTDGTGQAAGAVPGAVGKTGTSQDYRDALFIGWAGDLVVGVWVGNDDNSPMDEVTGGSLPAEIFTAFFQGAPEEVPDGTAEPEDAAPEIVASDMPSPQARPETLSDLPEPARAVAAPAPRPSASGGRSSAVETLLGRALNGQRVSARDVVNALQQDTSGGGARAAGNCNVSACERAYRSFRASDCTFQPYGNRPRELCTR